jgi:hypothetical protein
VGYNPPTINLLFLEKTTMLDNIFQRANQQDINVVSAKPLTVSDLDALETFIQTPFFNTMYRFLTDRDLPTNVFKRIGRFVDQPIRHYNGVPLFSISHHTRPNGWIMRIPINQAQCVYFSTAVISPKGLNEGQSITIKTFNYFIPNNQASFLNDLDQYLNIEEIQRRLG